jgi:hypothetical protein
MRNLVALISMIISVNCFSQSVPDQKLMIGKFDGRTPCQELAAILKQPTTPECIKIKWRVTLYKDVQKAEAGTFILEGFVFRGQNKLTGQWNLTKGTAVNPEAMVYELIIPNRSNLFLQKVDDNILFFLDPQKNLLVGDQYFSYVLNRAEPYSLFP